ncbi:MAG: hypothetical protein AMXMBFR20_11030 [Planctomycetia bacterium]
MTNSLKRLLTVGEIARLLGVELHRVEYIIRARKIKPSGRAGNLRVFLDEDVKHISAEIGHELRNPSVEEHEND